VVGRTGENFGVEKRWKKKKKSGQGGWDFCSSEKRLRQAHLQLVHWWLLIHSSRQSTTFLQSAFFCFLVQNFALLQSCLNFFVTNSMIFKKTNLQI